MPSRPGDDLGCEKLTPPIQDDNWMHRAHGMRCRSCMWFAYKVDREGHFTTIGRCRRHAPTVSGYPAVFVTDWCGDHKIDETKI